MAGIEQPTSETGFAQLKRMALMAAQKDRLFVSRDDLAALIECAEALHEGRRAIGDHIAPDHCYATGPVTGDPVRDLVQCPACVFIAMYDEAIAKLEAL